MFSSVWLCLGCFVSVGVFVVFDVCSFTLFRKDKPFVLSVHRTHSKTLMDQDKCVGCCVIIMID